MQPITATRIGALISFSPSVTCLASSITSTCARPQLGQEMMSKCRWRRPRYSRILQPTLTSSTGGADRDTRIVSPMPSASNAPNARHDLIVPCHAGPASVTPRCSGQSPLLASRRYVWTMVTGSWCLTEILKSWKPTSSNMRASFNAEATRASGVGPPYFAYSSLSSDPAFTPIRSEMPASVAALQIEGPTSSNLRILPGLTRTAAHPASIAWNTYLLWKWMSAITGSGDFATMAGSASASS